MISVYHTLDSYTVKFVFDSHNNESLCLFFFSKIVFESIEWYLINATMSWQKSFSHKQAKKKKIDLNVFLIETFLSFLPFAMRQADSLYVLFNKKKKILQRKSFLFFQSIGLFVCPNKKRHAINIDLIEKKNEG